MLKSKRLIFLILFLVPIAVKASVTVEPGVLFKLRKYDTFLQFYSEVNLSRIVVDEDLIYFDDYWFRLKGGNITFRDFLKDYKLTFYLEGQGTSEVEVYTPFKPLRILINGVEQEEGTTWTYNSTGNTVKIFYNFS